MKKIAEEELAAQRIFDGELTLTTNKTGESVKRKASLVQKMKKLGR